MIIQSRYVWYQEQFSPKQLVIEKGKIKDILEYNELVCDYDYGDLYVLPGFIDIHTHGMMGIDAICLDKEKMKTWQKNLCKEGVTSFLPTLQTQSYEKTCTSIKKLKTLIKQRDGAEALGIFLEGNFINKNQCGAQSKKEICNPNVDMLKDYINMSEGMLKRIILAIENDQDALCLKYAIQNSIEVSIGHSEASYEQVYQAKTLGLTSITHMYNAMKGFYHREIGIIGAGFLLPDLYTEIIADGYHVDFRAIQILTKLKDKHHLILVSDSSPMKGMLKIPNGFIIDENNQVRTTSYHLAGSVLKINDGVKNLLLKGGCTLACAINAATINPATLLKMESRKGSIDIGKDADLVVLDQDFQVQQTICFGNFML